MMLERKFSEVLQQRWIFGSDELRDVLYQTVLERNQEQGLGRIIPGDVEMGIELHESSGTASVVITRVEERPYPLNTASFGYGEKPPGAVDVRPMDC